MGGDFVSLRMLVVTDNELEREMLRFAASHASIPVEVTEITDCGSATASCEALARAAADIVFVDSQMPFAERNAIRDAAKASARAVFITLGTSAAQAQQAGVEGYGFVTRPLDPETLRMTVEGCVRARIPSRVLIVDDSATVRAVIQKVLKASRYPIVADDVAEGREALARVEERNYDLVFLDCNMPEVSGFETLAALLQRRPNLLVVMIAGTSSPDLIAKTQAAGAKELLVKPFYARDIDAVLSRLYGLMPSRDA